MSIGIPDSLYKLGSRSSHFKAATGSGWGGIQEGIPFGVGKSGREQDYSWLLLEEERWLQVLATLHVQDRTAVASQRFDFCVSFVLAYAGVTGISRATASLC